MIDTSWKRDNLGLSKCRYCGVGFIKNQINCCRAKQGINLDCAIYVCLVDV